MGNQPVRNLKNSKATSDDEAQNKIKDLAGRLSRGEDFGQLAQNYSEDPETAPNGGDMGFVARGVWKRPAPSSASWWTPLSRDLSPPVRTGDGYRILKGVITEPAGQRDLNDPRVQQSIRDTLLNRKDQLLKSATMRSPAITRRSRTTWPRAS